jgi:hypothetical protein
MRRARSTRAWISIDPNGFAARRQRSLQGSRGHVEGARYVGRVKGEMDAVCVEGRLTSLANFRLWLVSSAA